jgi:membrane-bound inhibitor of C-type lysozyme
MKKTWLIFIVVVLFAAALGYLYYGRQKVNVNQQGNNSGRATTSNVDAHGCDNSQGQSWCDIQQKCLGGSEKCVATTSANIVTFYCQEGILQANFSSSSVDLTFKDGSQMILPQTISGSGIRYATGTTVFSSEGDDAFLTQKDKTVYTNCVAGTQTSAQDINTYTDRGNTFSFSYPAQFVLSGGEIGYSQSWSYNSPDFGILFAVVNIPQEFLPKTNFGEAKFTVGTSADPHAIKNCLISDSGGTTTTEIINGTKFTKMNFVGVGAGNIYDVTAYHVILNSQCYAIEYMIHSSNIYNYSPDQGIKEFDKTKVELLLENMAQSFKFIPQQ